MIVLVDLLGLTIILPLLPLYAVSFGASPLTIGLIAAVYPTMQLIAGPYLGALSDRFGRKPVLLFSQLGTLSGFILLGFANALPLLLLSRMIDGLSGANISVAQAAITDMTTAKTRTQGLGLIGAAFGLGFTLGPAIGGIALTVSNNNYQVPAFLAAGFSLVAILLTAFLFKETHTESSRTEVAAAQASAPESRLAKLTRAFRSPLIGMLLILMFVQHLVFGGIENLIALFNLTRLGMNAASNTVLFIYVGVILVVVQGYAIGKWSRRFGERKLIFAGLALLSVGVIATALTPQIPVPWYSQSTMIAELNTGATPLSVTLPDDANKGVLGLVWLLVAMFPTGVGSSILSPSINSLLTKHSNPLEIGTILGVSASMLSLANIITPVLSGAMFQFLGSSAPFLIGGVILAALLGVALRVIKETPVPDAAADHPRIGASVI